MGKLAFAIAAFLLFPSSLFAQESQNSCKEISLYYDQILQEIAKKDREVISKLPDCFKRDRTLILKAVIIDPKQFYYAADELQEDQIFVMRLLKISPDILQYAAPEIRLDADFMERATYVSRDSLQYAAWNLLDNKLFMKKMIKIDSRNYKFASDRIKEITEFAEIAFADNGLLLEFATPKIKADKNLLKVAIKSNSSALDFASDKLKQDPELQKLAQRKTSIKSLENLQKFLEENYIVKNDKKNLGNLIENKAKNFSKRKIIDRNYVTKWQNYLDFSRIENGHASEDMRLIATDSRNYQISWREDFKKYPTLIKKIEKFFLNHDLAANTIDNLSTTYLWRIKNDPMTLAFNLYLLRDSTDSDLGSDFVDITSLTAIAQKRKDKWEMTIIETIIDSEIKVEVPYENGHKKYILWDLYVTDKNDKNPKIIFKVEDKFGDNFAVFEEQSGGKYQMILSK